MIPVMIVPVLTRPDLLERMLASIDYPVDTLVVIDNGHAWPGPFDPRPGVNNAYLLRMPSNLGVPASWNLGIKSTPFAPWWMVCNFDIEWPPGTLERFAQLGRRDALVLSGAVPPWAAFIVGENLVEHGLFDEYLHPAYLEDTDYERRMEAAGFDIVRSDIPIPHDNSSTLRSGYQQRNSETYMANLTYYQDKVARGDMGEGRWSLHRRRYLSWD